MMTSAKFSKWITALLAYRDPKIVAIFFLGFSSGLPLFLTSRTLFLWMADVGVNLKTIGVFALAGVPYTMKFVWSPILDQVRLPFLQRALGQRRSWLLLFQITLIFSLYVLAGLNPIDNTEAFALCTVFVAFFSASQDILVDALRIELVEEKQLGAATSSYTFGYRLGMMVAGTASLAIAHFSNWKFAYEVMALCMLVGVTTVVLLKEPSHPKDTRKKKSFGLWLQVAVVEPFSNFMGRKGWILILIFIPLFKIGDAFVSNMDGPFYLAMGFSKLEIAAVSKVWGVIMTLIGTFFGGVVVARYGIMRGLFYMGIFQLLSNGMFVIQAILGYNVPFLFVTIFMENLTGSMATVAFIAYLSALCDKHYTATQYALFASFMGMGRTIFSTPAGFAAEAMNWPLYFGFTMIIALPGLLILVWLMKNTPLDARKSG